MHDKEPKAIDTAKACVVFMGSGAYHDETTQYDPRPTGQNKQRQLRGDVRCRRATFVAVMKRATGLLLLLGVALLVFFITREVYRPAPPKAEGRTGSSAA